MGLAAESDLVEASTQCSSTSRRGVRPSRLHWSGSLLPRIKSPC